ncbi:Sel1 domain protein repeat-containing protein [Thermovirga lienii DSM 17291]|uniref:Sel1 domain protein repeat-containing protein n=1 Tax=Thermovirga lienii (strain ATCC BAA-1197 / DSM 17291 / Cas60314) TaxID=580340 RepID=G7V6E1_THELD|nr:tetratricopeptide repeat protein [Thermovirga lienii]AER65970.1 Sel1 domain protein repeat-containing protein [Thermovirga lienii DSM 17291]
MKSHKILKSITLVLLLAIGTRITYAAEPTNPKSQYILGLRYQLGDGVEKNMQKAYALYKKAAEQGYAPAQFAMGICYENGGHGITQDGQNAAYWYRRAALQGHTKAQLHLGNLYWFKDRGVPRNEQKAMDWWFVASVNGESKAQLYLAHRYFQLSEQQNDETYLKKAFYWYHEAASQGEASAQYALGVMFQMGRPVDKDLKTAVHWYKKAASQGHKEAYKRLKELRY